MQNTHHMCMQCVLCIAYTFKGVHIFMYVFMWNTQHTLMQNKCTCRIHTMQNTRYMFMQNTFSRRIHTVQNTHYMFVQYALHTHMVCVLHEECILHKHVGHTPYVYVVCIVHRLHFQRCSYIYVHIYVHIYVYIYVEYTPYIYVQYTFTQDTHQMCTYCVFYINCRLFPSKSVQPVQHTL